MKISQWFQSQNGKRSSVYLNACEDLLRAYAWLPVAFFIQDADGRGGGEEFDEMTVEHWKVDVAC
jgi:hypothetical protein